MRWGVEGKEPARLTWSGDAVASTRGGQALVERRERREQPRPWPGRRFSRLSD